MKTKLFLIVFLVLAACNRPPAKPITDFDSCVAAGNPVLESYPPRCRTRDNIYTQDIGNELELQDTVQISNPRPNQKITSPLNVTGQARGNWFFESYFPVKLLDQKNQVITEGLATAQGEWMTENFVPFTATLDVPSYPPGYKATLVLEKANASGLPENDQSLIIPVIF